MIEIFDKLIRVGDGVIHVFDQGVDLHLEAGKLGAQGANGLGIEIVLEEQDIVTECS